MWILCGIILVLAVSNCSAQYGDEDLLLIASAPTCEVGSAETEEDGVCVKESQCSVPLIMPDPEISISTCSWSTGCCPKNKVTVKHEVKTPTQLGCGYSNPGGFRMRTFAEEKATYASYADFPWMVALMVKKDIPNKTFLDEYIGGGTLIHPSVVMTVAHKVYKLEANELKCRAGEWNWLIENEQDEHQERDVADVVVHENFHKVQVFYDVALLFLSSPYNLENAPHIRVGCLEPILPSPGTVCYSMGWGKDIRNDKKNAVILKKLQLPLVGREECESLLKSTLLGNRYKLHKSFTCAGGEAGVDTCQGDGGSPLVCSIPDPSEIRYSVVGMVSYGVDCGKANVPGVYSKVPEFYDWIISQMTKRNFNTSSFKYV